MSLYNLINTIYSQETVRRAEATDTVEKVADVTGLFDIISSLIICKIDLLLRLHIIILIVTYIYGSTVEMDVN